MQMQTSLAAQHYGHFSLNEICLSGPIRCVFASVSHDHDILGAIRGYRLVASPTRMQHNERFEESNLSDADNSCWQSKTDRS
jgi:hypothetical protein